MPGTFYHVFKATLTLEKDKRVAAFHGFKQKVSWYLITVYTWWSERLMHFCSARGSENKTKVPKHLPM